MNYTVYCKYNFFYYSELYAPSPSTPTPLGTTPTNGVLRVSTMFH